MWVIILKLCLAEEAVQSTYLMPNHSTEKTEVKS